MWSRNTQHTEKHEPNSREVDGNNKKKKKTAKHTHKTRVNIGSRNSELSYRRFAARYMLNFVHSARVANIRSAPQNSSVTQGDSDATFIHMSFSI